MKLAHKKILVGITGSIAAYKAAFLVRLLIKAQAEVRVVMTQAATDFISPLTLSTLSQNPVFMDVSGETGWNNHVEMGLWADAFVIAPLTANTLAKLANGFCDNMLTASYLSSRCPVFFAPAMDLDMWAHPATQANVGRLLDYGNHLIPVEEGELASGLQGKGRMAEPETIVQVLEQFFNDQTQQPLLGKQLLITSGPTIEAIDPVRFISNHSTGKMGNALALQAAKWGAEVTLVSGRVADLPQHTRLRVVSVLSAQEMYEAAAAHFDQADISILAAAVADYTPEVVANQKIKKKEETFSIQLKKTTDIAAELGKRKRDGQLLVGFALETNDALDHARQKMQRKNLDLIVVNTLEDSGAGFGHDTNRIALLTPQGEPELFELKSKSEVALDILHKICVLMK